MNYIYKLFFCRFYGIKFIEKLYDELMECWKYIYRYW